MSRNVALWLTGADGSTGYTVEVEDAQGRTYELGRLEGWNATDVGYLFGYAARAMGLDLRERPVQPPMQPDPAGTHHPSVPGASQGASDE